MAASTPQPEAMPAAAAQVPPIAPGQPGQPGPPGPQGGQARAPQGAVSPQGTLAGHEPGSGKLVGEVRVATPAQVREAVAASRAAQVGWGRLTFEERAAILQRFKQLLLDRAEEICDLITRENGKTRNESLFMELLPVADLTHWFAKNAGKLLRDEKLRLHMFPHKQSYVRFYPRGVIGIISPWNYPFSIPTGDVVMALLAGNGAVLKPSEFTPIIAEKARALLEEAGVPRGLVQVVQGRGEVGAALVQSGVDMVVFTGSVATGRKVNVATMAFGRRWRQMIVALETPSARAAVIYSKFRPRRNSARTRPTSDTQENSRRMPSSTKKPGTSTDDRINNR